MKYTNILRGWLIEAKQGGIIAEKQIKTLFIVVAAECHNTIND